MDVRLAALFDELSLDYPKETLNWLSNTNTDDEVSTNTLSDWLRIDEPNYSVEKEYTFCEPKHLDEYYNPEKEAINLEMKKSAKPANLFGGMPIGYFSSRSGIKFANLDALINFTNPLDPFGKPVFSEDETVNYVDLTSCPDFGFIEYMQFRKRNHTRGFAFDTEDSYKMWYKFCPEDRPTCELNRDVKGSVVDPTVIRDFVKFVRRHLPEGAHLVCSDSIECDRESDEPQVLLEKIIKRFLLRQCILGLATTAVNGTFIVKMNNLLTPFMVGLVYLVRLHFREMTIVKPLTSWSYNSERYVVFRWKLSTDSTTLQDHLLNVNETMIKMTGRDIVELVPLDVIRADVQFFNYVVECNNRLMAAQIPEKRKLIVYLTTGKITVDWLTKQKVWRLCFQIWNLSFFEKDMERQYQTIKTSLLINDDFIELSSENFDQHLGNYSDSKWYFAEISHFESDQRPTFFLGKDDHVEYRLDNGSWLPLSNQAIKLPPGTLVYGQLVQELHHENNKTVPSGDVCLHVIDVHYQDFKCLLRRPIWFRQKLLQELSNDHVGVRPMTAINRLTEFVVKARRNWETIDFDIKRLVFRAPFKRTFYKAGGLILISDNDHQEMLGKSKLFWNWSSNTYNVVNGMGLHLHLGRFEELLGKTQRYSSVDGPRSSFGVGWQSDRKYEANNQADDSQKRTSSRLNWRSDRKSEANDQDDSQKSTSNRLDWQTKNSSLNWRSDRQMDKNDAISGTSYSPKPSFGRRH